MVANEVPMIADEEIGLVPMFVLRRAIASAFFETERRLDVRYLWTKGRISYFRVNWWRSSACGPAEISRSAFVAVEPSEDGWKVLDLTALAAA